MPATVKERVIDAYVDLMNEKDERDITLKELLSRSGVSRSAFYYNFNNVDDVLQQLMNRFVEEVGKNYDIRREISPDGSVNLSRASDRVKNTVRYISNHRREFSALLSSSMRDYLRYRIIRVCDEGFVQFDYTFEIGGVTRHLTHAEREYYGRYAAYTFYSFVELWAKRSYQEEPDELVNMIASICSARFVNMSV